MKLRNKKTILFLLIAIITLSPVGEVLACTGTIVGKGISADGDPIIARTEDWSSCYNKTLKVTPAKTYEKGAMFEDVYGFSYPMPEKTYKYVSIPDGYQEEGDIFEAAGWNEMGVTMTATVTAGANEKALEADPLTDEGIYESSVVSVVLPRIKTAREGVEVLGDIMDTKGVQEGAVIVIADQKEIWYMELLTGHQYCAVKYPDDAYSVFPNCFMLGAVDVTDTENVYASKDLVNLPKEHGFLVEEDGKIHIRKTYAETLSSGNRDRLWGGINFLDKDKNIPHDAEEFELFQKTDKKISVKDIMELQRYRNEGTNKDVNNPNVDKSVRPIGTVEQEECHVIQIKQDYPKEIGGILWVAMGNAEHAMYVPVMGPIDKVIAPYQVMGNEFNENSAYWNMRQVSALSELDRNSYGAYVREYFDKQEKQMLAAQKEIDKKIIAAGKESPKKAVDVATKYSVAYQEKAYSDAKELVKELNTYFFDVSNNKGFISEKGIPFIPSFLGEDRKEEIYKERNLSLGKSSAQPLDKGEETEEKSELEGHWAKVVMEKAVEQGLLQLKDGKYLPNETVSVNEFIASLQKVNSTFETTELSKKLEEYNINGTSGLTRQTMAFILQEYVDKVEVKATESKEVTFKDEASIEVWAQESVKVVTGKGFIKGIDGNFAPKGTVTRAQVAQIVMNLK